MLAQDAAALTHITKAIVAGATVGVVIVAIFTGFDLGSISSMMGSSRGGAFIATVFVFGTALKGAAFGLALADFDRRGRRGTVPNLSPAAARA